METKLNIPKFLKNLSDISEQYWHEFKTNIESYLCEKFNLEDQSSIDTLFVVLLSIQLQCMKNIKTINHEQIEESIFHHLQQLGFSEEIKKEINYYLQIFKKEERYNLRPLSGIALAFLTRAIGKQSLDNILA